MNEKKPFNDVGEHYQKHVGGIPSNADLKKMPKMIRLIGYFLIGCAAIFIVLFLFGWLIS
ncbi:amino acid transporter [Solibacillus sp. FSL K6-1523]|uniref:amino acid transporter n=1 Tax=Solibacillus sp. FSL K6-1523 TaxID=2921471 RepID=UPI0030F4F0BE